MVTTRPLMQLGIADLEESFDKQGKNPDVVARLKHELSFRQVPRAIALLEKIHRAEALLDDVDNSRDGQGTEPVLKNSEMSSSDGEATHTEQQDFFTRQAISEDGTEKEKPPATPPAVVPSVKNRGATVEPEALPQLALEDACRILKVVAGDPWGKVEAARRKIVLKSSPLSTKGLSSEQVQKLLAEAQAANDAAIVIAARRSGRQ